MIRFAFTTLVYQDSKNILGLSRFNKFLTNYQNGNLFPDKKKKKRMPQSNKCLLFFPLLP